MGFENTQLWKRTLGEQGSSDLHSSPRAALRNAFFAMRDRAATLAGQIACELPDLTVHDVTHLDALWETASLTAGDDYPLNPAEAFVLGAAFLLHDLALSSVAYPGGLAALRNDPRWKDLIAASLRAKLGRAGTPQEIKTPDAETERQVTAGLLRLRHADEGERLALESWKSRDGTMEYYLIDSPELRSTYGPVAGKIARSHWWAVDELRREFSNTQGAKPGWSYKWTVDALKVAALLRVSDVTHIDDRRAPEFLMALRDPSSPSYEHWAFQTKLLQPRLQQDRLVYTSKQPFKVNEAEAWWLCFDTLQTIDQELRSVDSLLADSQRPRLKAKGVAGAESPTRLSNLIGAKGWLPIDARVQVSDVASLARNIGGEQLYGEDKTVPLRELIQNASDAVRARRVLEGRARNWGNVTVRLGSDDSGHWIEVEDNGLGMSTEVLRGPLLDFGVTYWGSDLMLREHPGLFGKGFQPTGKYGIGFFSVFMWGDQVRITTRSYQDAIQDTNVLEFRRALFSRPLLRKASEFERMSDGGTCVRVWWKNDRQPASELLSLKWAYRGKHKGLGYLCEWLCPCLDVNLYVQVDKAHPMKRVVSANDWIKIKPEKLLARIVHDWVDRGPEKRSDVVQVWSLLRNLRLLKDAEGRIIGRAALVPRRLLESGWWSHEVSVITVGGLRASSVFGVMGVLHGLPREATRYSAVPVVEQIELARWATEQADLFCKITRKPISDIFLDDILLDVASLVKACGGDVGKLPIARGQSGLMNFQQISNLARRYDEVFVIRDPSKYDAEISLCELNPSVLLVTEGQQHLSVQGDRHLGLQWPIHGGPVEPIRPSIPSESTIQPNSLKEVVLEALAAGWSTTVHDIAKASEFCGALEDGTIMQVIGTKKGKDVRRAADRIRNPNELRPNSR